MQDGLYHANAEEAASDDALPHGGCVVICVIVKMKVLTVRLPDVLMAEIEAEARARGISKSQVVRERLERGRASTPTR